MLMHWDIKYNNKKCSSELTFLSAIGGGLGNFILI